MGVNFTDKYSLLHFAVGIVAYFWNVPFRIWFIIHLLFEYIENTQCGMQLIRMITWWPGGKSVADSFLNSVGDQFYSLLGWIFAYYFNFIFKN